ncbi:MAG: aldehyde dehydrogenase family protein [Oscillospiraceae bacterium]|jgi:acyl-CoA reductase-like NAD-dependent aldehyde dehydrogenase
MREFRLFIGGEWVPTVTGKVIDDINPANGSVFARVHTAGPEEVEAAIASAYAARMTWAETLPEEREKILLKAADHMEANIMDFCARLIDESGSTFMKAMGELMECVNIFRAAAGECRRVDGTVFPPDMPGQMSFCVRQPLGVIGGIAPFNYPVLLALNKVALALAAGNTFVLKPSSDTPVSGIMIAECLEAAGLPKGVLSVIPGPGGVVGSALIDDDRVRMITFTGSTRVGRAIARRAAEKLKKYTLEMGGKNPLIVLKDYDLDRAVDIAAFGAYFHQGQICMATSRIIVEEPIYEDFCARMTEKVKKLKVGDPRKVDTVIGPLIHRAQCAVLDGHIADAVGKGARLLTGGTHEGAYYAPSLLADVTPDMKVFYEESFGPLTSIIKARDARHALELCNDNHYGLAAALLTNDVSLALKMALMMEAGMVHVNDSTVMGSRRAPFGGIKNSGIGREDSAYSIDEFTEKKWITIQCGERGYPV